LISKQNITFVKVLVIFHQFIT